MAGGRPSKYNPKFNEQAYKLALLGATDKQLADFFEVDERTINRWKQSEDEFRQSLKKGKDVADSTVAQNLYRRAIGYKYKEEHETQTPDGIISKTIWKEALPDTTAQIFWLKNRQPKQWRDKVDHDVSVKDVLVDFED